MTNYVDRMNNAAYDDSSHRFSGDSEGHIRDEDRPSIGWSANRLN
jgi:hypothetical protein